MAFSPAVLVLALALTMVLRAGPDAPPATRQTPEAEVDALLASTVAKSPLAEVVVVVVGPDPKLYHLEEATLRLDGTPVRATSASEVGPLAQGRAVTDGEHVVTARFVYRGQALGPLPWEEGPVWKLPARVTVQASRGLRFIVRLTVETNERAPAGMRLSLSSDVEPQMLRAVDDGPLPPPPVPHLVPPPVVSPPAPVAAAPSPAAAPAPKKKAPKKKVARPAATSVPTAATAVAPAAGSADALAEATARLKSALAAPADGGVAGEAPH